MNPTTLSAFSVTVTVLSLLVGILTQAVQSGKVFGQFAIPTSAMVWLTLVLPLLGGVVASLTTSGTLTTASIFYAVVQGVGDALVGATPGLAVHAHFVVPAKLASLRALRGKPAANTNTVATEPPKAA
jgi:hypothetical protein